MKNHLSCTDYYEDDQYYWFSEMEYNGFYRVDKKTKESELLFRFPGEEEDTASLHAMLVKAEDWFIFAPKTGKDIVLYHSLTQEVKVIALSPVMGQRKIPYQPQMKFSSLVYHQGMVYFFPVTYPAVVVLDLHTMKIREMTLCQEKLEKHLGNPSEIKQKQYFRCVFHLEDQVYLPCICSNHVVVLDLRQEKVTVFPVPAQKLGFNGITYDGTFFWMTPFRGKELVGWSPQGGYQSLMLAEQSNNSNECVNPMLYENTLIIGAGAEDTLYQVHLDDMTVAPYLPLTTALSSVRGFAKRNLPFFTYARIVGDVLHVICSKDKGFYSFDLVQETLQVEHFPVDPVGEEILQKKVVFYFEKKHNTLMDFCEFLLEHPEETREIKQEQTVGGMILEATTGKSVKKEKGRK